MSDIDLPDLADERLGGAAVTCNDEFFAPASNLVRSTDPEWDEHRYTDRGKWMDGWETRRRRSPGSDWAIVRLGVPGVLEQVVVDTSHFRGNHPEAFELEGAFVAGTPGPADLDQASWVPLVGHTALGGDARNVVDDVEGICVSHVRLTIHPDGGVARLRLHGSPMPDWVDIAGGGARLDLASILHGGRVMDVSDRFFSAPDNLLRPGPPRGMHDGWETRRRRGSGNDWVVVALGAPAAIEQVEVDTSHFKGNAPGACQLFGRRGAGSWMPLTDRRPLQPHTLHRLETVEGTVVDQVRLDIHPDGGVGRLRALGRITTEDLAAAALQRLDVLPAVEAERLLLTCCGSRRWGAEMARRRPFGDLRRLRRSADEVWSSLEREDRMEAFRSHPRLGERQADRDTGPQASRWSEREQAGVADTDRSRLVEIGREYEQRFGHLLIICATGLTSREMLAQAEQRMGNDPDTEFEVASREQARITQLRIAKLLGIAE